MLKDIKITNYPASATPPDTTTTPNPTGSAAERIAWIMDGYFKGSSKDGTASLQIDIPVEDENPYDLLPKTFDPKKIPGLVAWFDAYDEDTINFDSTTGAVNSWTSKGSNTKALTNTGTNRPTYSAISKTISFLAGNSQFLTNAEFFTLPPFKSATNGMDAAFTIICVNGEDSYPDIEIGHGTVGNYSSYIRGGGGGTYGGALSLAVMKGIKVLSKPKSNTPLYLLDVIPAANPSSLSSCYPIPRVYVNGAVRVATFTGGTQPTYNGAAFSTGVLTVGRYISGYLTSTVQQLLIYDRDLNEPEIRAVITYLMRKQAKVTMDTNMVKVAGGTFSRQNSDGSYPTPPVMVTLSSFYMDKYETTQAGYQAVMGVNPANSYGVGDNYPVYYVSWFNAIEYCNRRSMQEGLTPCYSYSSYGTNPASWPSGWNSDYNNHTNVSCNWSATGYRLPTEMEWMFAAKGGNQSQGYTYGGSNTIGDVAWYNANNTNEGYPSGTKPVGLKLANELGLYDLSGNVWEWVWDIYGDYPGTSQNNPTGANSGSNRVKRGGSWYGGAVGCTVSYRNSNSATVSNAYLGFRCVRVSP